MKNRLLALSTIFLSFYTFTSACVKQTDEKARICMILDKGGKDDKSFNQSAYEGFLKALKDFNLSKDSKYVVAQEDTQSEQFTRAFSKGTCGLIIAIGFSNADIVGKIAPQFPEQKYVVVDASLKQPNIRSISFQEHEGSFLVGAIAALKSKSNQIGFIGGMEIPLIKRFSMGYSAGAKYINPNIKVTETYIGLTATAWNNPTKAKELALSLYNKGNDVIFAAAGASYQGVFDAAQEKSTDKSKKFVIGVDSNQNYLAPGLVLTSMEKKVNIAVYTAAQDYTENKFTAGAEFLGLASGGVDWSYDQYNKSLFSEAELAKINEIKKDIIDNKINVPDYYKIGGTNIN